MWRYAALLLSGIQNRNLMNASSLSQISLRVNAFGHCGDARLSVGNELMDFVGRERVARLIALRSFLWWAKRGDV